MASRKGSIKSTVVGDAQTIHDRHGPMHLDVTDAGDHAASDVLPSPGPGPTAGEAATAAAPDAKPAPRNWREHLKQTRTRQVAPNARRAFAPAQTFRMVVKAARQVAKIPALDTDLADLEAKLGAVQACVVADGSKAAAGALRYAKEKFMEAHAAKIKAILEVTDLDAQLVALRTMQEGDSARIQSISEHAFIESARRQTQLRQQRRRRGLLKKQAAALSPQQGPAHAHDADAEGGTELGGAEGGDADGEHHAHAHAHVQHRESEAAEDAEDEEEHMEDEWLLMLEEECEGVSTAMHEADDAMMAALAGAEARIKKRAALRVIEMECLRIYEEIEAQEKAEELSRLARDAEEAALKAAADSAAARRARQLATVLAKETEAIMERDRLREKVQAVERDLARLQALRAAEEAKQALALAEGRPFDEELLTDLRALEKTARDDLRVLMAQLEHAQRVADHHMRTREALQARHQLELEQELSALPSAMVGMLAGPTPQMSMLQAEATEEPLGPQESNIKEEPARASLTEVLEGLCAVVGAAAGSGAVTEGQLQALVGLREGLADLSSAMITEAAQESDGLLLLTATEKDAVRSSLKSLKDYARKLDAAAAAVAAALAAGASSGPGGSGHHGSALTPNSMMSMAITGKGLMAGSLGLDPAAAALLAAAGLTGIIIDPSLRALLRAMEVETVQAASLVEQIASAAAIDMDSAPPSREGSRHASLEASPPAPAPPPPVPEPEPEPPKPAPQPESKNPKPPAAVEDSRGGRARRARAAASPVRQPVWAGILSTPAPGGPNGPTKVNIGFDMSSGKAVVDMHKGGGHHAAGLAYQPQPQPQAHAQPQPQAQTQPHMSAPLQMLAAGRPQALAAISNNGYYSDGAAGLHIDSSPGSPSASRTPPPLEKRLSLRSSADAAAGINGGPWPTFRDLAGGGGPQHDGSSPRMLQQQVSNSTRRSGRFSMSGERLGGSSLGPGGGSFRVRASESGQTLGLLQPHEPPAPPAPPLPPLAPISPGPGRPSWATSNEAMDMLITMLAGMVMESTAPLQQLQQAAGSGAGPTSPGAPADSSPAARSLTSSNSLVRGQAAVPANDWAAAKATPAAVSAAKALEGILSRLPVEVHYILINAAELLMGHTPEGVAPWRLARQGSMQSGLMGSGGSNPSSGDHLHQLPAGTVPASDNHPHPLLAGLPPLVANYIAQQLQRLLAASLAGGKDGPSDAAGGQARAGAAAQSQSQDLSANPALRYMSLLVPEAPRVAAAVAEARRSLAGTSGYARSFRRSYSGMTGMMGVLPGNALKSYPRPGAEIMEPPGSPGGGRAFQKRPSMSGMMLARDMDELGAMSPIVVARSPALQAASRARLSESGNGGGSSGKDRHFLPPLVQPHASMA